MNIKLKSIAIGQLLLGVLCVAVPIFMSPHTEKLAGSLDRVQDLIDSPEYSGTIAADSMSSLLNTVHVLGAALSDAFGGILACGVFMLFSGFVIILHIRKHDEASSV